MFKSFIIFALIISFYSNISAQKNGIGLGVIAGEPTGISLKKWIGKTSAIDGAIAWSFGNQGALHLHANYLIHNFGVVKKIQGGRLPVYYGIGARVKLEKDIRIGIRGPVGVNYIFDKHPLDFFLEIVPLLELVPNTAISINGAIGVRYFF
jgi:hypothetical protein